MNRQSKRGFVKQWKILYEEFPHGARGSSASLEPWGIGSIPGPAQWVKDPVLPQLWHRSQLELGSDSWPGNSIRHGAAKNEKKKNTMWYYNDGYMSLYICSNPQNIQHWDGTSNVKSGLLWLFGCQRRFINCVSNQMHSSSGGCWMGAGAHIASFPQFCCES